MRTFLAVIGALFLLLIVGVVGSVVFVWQRMTPLKREAVQFVDDALPAILANWNGEALRDRASEEFRDVLTPDKLEELMMSGISQFGPMTNYGGAKCTVTRFAYQSSVGEVAEAECKASAGFARVQAEIRTSAVKREDAWKLSALFVEAMGQSEPLRREASVRPRGLPVVEASLGEGFIALSAHGRAAPIGASIGSFEAVILDR